MDDFIVIQARKLTTQDLDWIRGLMADHPDWGRYKLSLEICRQWGWCNALGQLKDMAARTMLLKLERRGLLVLPVRQLRVSCSKRQRKVPKILCATEPIGVPLGDLQPLRIQVVLPKSVDATLFNGLLAHYHYLGHRHTVGETMRYLVWDRFDRPVACLLFGAAAWHCADRDKWMGWDRAIRDRNLQRLTNNTRFLILPWVVVPHLASHVLSLVTRRIRADWMSKYGHPVDALETFVDRDRFRGSCYRAANWQHVGKTKGRTRNEKEHLIAASVKDVYLYPLISNFRQELCL
jgi:hypothetical protein